MVREIRVGPLVIGVRKREQLPQEWRELAEAVDSLGRAVLAQPEMAWLARQVGRLNGWIQAVAKREA